MALKFIFILQVDWNAPKVLPPVSKNPAVFPELATQNPVLFPQLVSNKNTPIVPKTPVNVPKVPDLRNKPPSISINYYPPKDEHTSTTTEKWRGAPQNFANLPNLGKFGQKTTPNRRNYFPSKVDDYFPHSSKVRPVVVDFARPSYDKRNEQKINLNTEYFIKKGETTKSTTTTTTKKPLIKRFTTPRRRRRLSTIPPRIPILVKVSS